MFKGSITALLTPFKNGSLDEEAFRRLVNWQIEEGSHGLVPCGTTGEAPTLDEDEFKRVVELCVEVANKRVPVIAGTGSNSTAKTIKATKLAKEIGADAALIVTPYYNKPTQAGLYEHYKAVNDAVDIPVIMYNIPGRSVINLTVETEARLSKLPNIIGVKDSTGDLARPLQTLRASGESFCQFSSEDPTALAFLIQGGHGCISVVSNLTPKLCAEMQNAWRDGDLSKAMKINYKLQPLREALFCETSPGPLKYGASLMGLCSAEARLPITEIAAASKTQVEEALRGLELI